MTKVVLANLDDEAHQAAIVAMLDMYCRDEFGDGQPLSTAARERLIPGLQKHGGARVFLAYEADRPVGLAICLLGFSTFRGLAVLNIHYIAVDPSFRGRGVGRELLAAVEAHARELGCGKVTLEVRSDNARAMAAYRRAGFQPTQPETFFWSRLLD
jgi:ribosomal protein S18 acetylase RimI-like enzyme